MPSATAKNRGHAMPDLHIRNVDPALIERLKRQAKENGRSMEAEARAVLENGTKLTMREWVEGMRKLREGDPPWQPGMPTSVELLHEARKEREDALDIALYGRTFEDDDDADR